MSKARFSPIQRAALSRANKNRCFYCEAYVEFADLEIDHLILESTSSERLANLTENLGLEKDLDLNSTQNLVPTHHNCNRRKSSHEFSEGTLRWYLELWKTKQRAVQEELRRLKRQANKAKLLTSVAAQIEAGYLSMHEVLTFLRGTKTSTPATPSEPWVLTFGVNVSDLLESGDDAYAHSDYPSLCERLEAHLLKDLRAHTTSLSVQTEASERSGETLSIRVAFWNLDLDQLERVDIEPWEILEISPYSEVYDQEWDQTFAQAVVETYHQVISDPEDSIFGYKYCPMCGNPELRRSEAADYHGDEVYYFIECTVCGWGER